MDIGANLRTVLTDQDYDRAIELVRAALSDDIRNLIDPEVKRWLSLRFRNLFITAAAADPLALENAPHYADHTTRIKSKIPLMGHETRPERQVVAESYLREHGHAEWQLEMPAGITGQLDNTTLVFVPGFGAGLLPGLEFPTIFPRLADDYGWRILRVDVNPLASCETVGHDIDRTVTQGLGLDAAGEVIDPEDAVPPENIIFIGYSKGTPDVLAYLVEHPEIAERTKGLITWVGAARGSHLARQAYQQIKDVDLPVVPEGLSRITEAFLRLLAPYLNLDSRALKRASSFDLKAAVRELLPEVRERFLAENADKIDALNLPILSLTGSTDITRVPTSQIQGLLALADYDLNNDMQVTQYESTLENLPLATHLARLHANHWDFSFEAWPKAYRLTSPNMEHKFPKQAILIALIQLMNETGLLD